MAGMKWGPEDWERLGVEIRSSRDRQGYSRKKLAEMSGVSEKSIQLTEEGRVPTRWPKSLDALEVALDWVPGTMIRILNGFDPRTELRDGTPLKNVDQGVDAVVTTPSGVKQVVEVKRYRAPRWSSRDIELTQSGYMAQDVFMRQAKRYREMLGISTEELASRIEGPEGSLTQRDIERLENGTRLLKRTDAARIAQALETTVEWLLGSGFSDDAPEELRRPPNAEELEAEAKAVQRRLGDIGGEVLAAQRALADAQYREMSARRDTEMAESALRAVSSHEREVERQYQYLIGRIDSLRAAAGQQTVMEMVPVYEEVEDDDPQEG